MYTVESKDLTTAIGKCVAIVAMGTKSETGSIALEFTKKGLALEARNSFASYRTDLPVEIETGLKRRVNVLPEVLLAYARSAKTLTLIPKEEALMVKSGKAFSAQTYYVGDVDVVETTIPEDGTDLAKIAGETRSILQAIGGMRNRTDTQALGVVMSWGDALDLVVGDSHHAVVVDSQVKSKSKGSVTMTLPNLQKIIDIGSNFAIDNGRFVAWSETEYLSILSQSENMFLANTARQALDGKKLAVAKMKTADLKSMVEGVTGAVEETAVVGFEFSEKELAVSTNTNSGKARIRGRVGVFKGKPLSIGVTNHHLSDCLAAMKESEVTISIFKGMVMLQGSNEKTTYKALMAASAGI